MRDQSKFLEEICVVVFPYYIDDYGNDIERKNRRHCRILNVERRDGNVVTMLQMLMCIDFKLYPVHKLRFAQAKTLAP